MIHRGRNRDAGWHFVVEQTPNASTQSRFDAIVQCIIPSVGCGVDGSGEIAFKSFQAFQEFVCVNGNDNECSIAETFALQVIISTECLSVDTQERVLESKALTISTISTCDRR